jgi:hypothetical protein
MMPSNDNQERQYKYEMELEVNNVNTTRHHSTGEPEWCFLPEVS